MVKYIENGHAARRNGGVKKAEMYQKYISAFFLCEQTAVKPEKHAKYVSRVSENMQVVRIVQVFGQNGLWKRYPGNARMKASNNGSGRNDRSQRF